MRAVFIIALIAAVALAKKDRAEITDDDRATYNAIRHEKLAKLSPEAQAIGTLIKEVYPQNKGDIKTAHKEIHNIFNALSESVRAELKSLTKGRKARAAPGEKKQLTEAQKEELKACLNDNFDKLSEDAKTAAKKIKEAKKKNKDDKKAIMKAIDKVLEGLSDKVRKELKNLCKQKKEKKDTKA